MGRFMFLRPGRNLLRWLPIRAGIPAAAWLFSFVQPREVSGGSFQFQPLGKPTANRVEAARKINVLTLFQSRLYLGHGDWHKNTGPTDVIYYDIEGKKFATEYRVEEEAIVRYRRNGKRLFLPGTDSTESWEFGNLYVHEDSAWKKHRTIPRGLHVFDFAEHDGRWYVATGSYFDSIKKGPWIGAIYSSTNQAASWQYEFTTSSSQGRVSRITSLMPYRGRLFAVTQTDGPIPREPGVKTKQYNRVAKPVVHDGAGWFPADILSGVDLVQTIEPFVFANHLLLSVRQGRYGDQFKNQWLLFAYDNRSTRQIPLECDRIVDTLVKEDRLILLLARKGKHSLVETTDLVQWKTHPIAPQFKQPLSVEYADGTYYLGLTDGTVLAAIAAGD
jgi:hypothetical protein